MTDHTFSDKLLNSFNAKAQDWGAATENESLESKVLLRRRNAYYKARRELEEYMRGLERSAEGLAVKVDELESELATIYATNRQLQDALGTAHQDLRVARDNTDTLTKLIEARNRSNERGEDEIGKLYIERLGIPELTTVFNRTVLGK